MNAREKLKKETGQSIKLARQVEQLKEAMAGAEGMINEAETALAAFNGLDKAISTFRVKQLKDGASPKILPDELRARVVAKREAEEELSQATNTRDSVQEELDAAEFRLAPMETERSKRAIDVLHEMADGLATELIQINLRGRDLRQILSGLANLHIGIDGRMQQVGYTAAIGSALSSCDYVFSGNMDPGAGMGERWKARLDALLSDPDAEVTIPKPIAPSDYTVEPIPYDGPGFRMPQLSTKLLAEN